MKQLILISIALLGMQINLSAQNPITANSTAEECIAFIDKMANTRLSDDKYKYFYTFNGTTFKEIETSKNDGLVSVYEHMYIDWAELAFFSHSKKDKVIDINFNFKNSFVLIRNFCDSRSKSLSSFFWFSIPLSQENKIKELEIAAIRLAQLAKAKNSTRLIVNTPPDAFKELPTEEKTKEYIHNLVDAFNDWEYDYDLKLDFDEIRINWAYTIYNGAVADVIKLDYENLKGIKLIENKIVFLGKASRINQYTGNTTNIDRFSISLKATMSQTEKDKLLKAFKHWAWLHNVDLVDDDLF